MKTKKFLLSLLGLSVAAGLNAQTWTNAAAGVGWNVAGNWSDDAVPAWGNTVDLTWANAGGNSFIGYAPAAWSDGQVNFRSITFNSTLPEAVTITLSRAAGFNDTARPINFNSSTGTASITVQSGTTVPITFSGGDVAVATKTFVLDSDLLVTNNGSGLLTLPGGRMTGEGNLTFAGSGITRISDDGGSTERTGLTTIQSGIVSVERQRNVNGILDTTDTFVTVQNGATLAVENTFTDAQIGQLFSSPGTVFQAGARLGFNTLAGDRTYNTAITDTSEGALGVTKIGGNTLTLGGTNTYTGGTFINEGVVSVAAVANLGGNVVGNTINLNGGTLSLSSTGNLVTGNRGVVIGSNGGTINVANVEGRVQITQQNASFGGSGDLTITGPGRVILGAIESATFTGNFIVTDGGRLQTNTPEHLGPGTITLDNGTFMSNTTPVNPATFTNNMILGSVGGTLATVETNRAFIYNGNISGTGALTIGNTGINSNVTLGGAVTHLGDTTIEAGSTMTLANGGSMTFVIGANNVNNGLLGDGTVNLDGEFIFDLTSAAAVGSWTIVATDTLTENFGVTFGVAGWSQSGNEWTSGDFTFDQSTGVLTAVPEPATYALIGGLLALGAVLIRRRMK